MGPFLVSETVDSISQFTSIASKAGKAFLQKDKIRAVITPLEMRGYFLVFLDLK